MKPQESLKEGWVEFTRFHCKEGYIDRWIGDAYHDPNRETKSIWCINSLAQYYRLNGGEWVKSRMLFNLLDNVQELYETHTAEQIWIKSLKP